MLVALVAAAGMAAVVFHMLAAAVAAPAILAVSLVAPCQVEYVRGMAMLQLL